MDFTSMIGPILGFVASASTSSVVDDIVKLATPPATKAVTRFGIKLGTAVVGGLAAGIVSRFVVINVKSIIKTLQDDTSNDETLIEEN